MKMHVTRDWIQRMAALEGNGEIGAGRRTMTIGLTAEEIAALEDLSLKALPEWARTEIVAYRALLSAARDVVGTVAGTNARHDAMDRLIAAVCSSDPVPIPTPES